MNAPGAPKQPADSDPSAAAGRIGLAVERLAGRYPFHAKVLERFRLQCRLVVPTMGVSASRDGVLLLYNPAFVLAIRLDELVGVLLHEVHHVVLGHLLADPSHFPDEWARVVAEEVTVNEFITEPLPATPILLCQFPGLPPGESTRQRYDRLQNHTGKRQPVAGPRLSNALSSATRRGVGRGRADRAEARRKPALVDDHSVWAEGRSDAEACRAAIRAQLHDAASEVGAERVPECLRRVLVDLGIGLFAGDGRYELQQRGSGSLPWALLLRRYAGRLLRRHPDFRRLPRRCPRLIGVVPGRARRANRPAVMAVIDTSGSITPALLEQISAELAGLATRHEVTVVECDAAVHDVYPFRPLTAVSGRGGTDLCPPLEPAFIKEHRPDLVVYFTDGFGPAPDREPRGVQVIWCLTTGGVRPAEWGRVIRMDGTPDNA